MGSAPPHPSAQLLGLLHLLASLLSWRCCSWLPCSCLVWGNSAQIYDLWSSSPASSLPESFTSGHRWSHIALCTVAFRLRPSCSAQAPWWPWSGMEEEGGSRPLLFCTSKTPSSLATNPQPAPLSLEQDTQFNTSITQRGLPVQPCVIALEQTSSFPAQDCKAEVFGLSILECTQKPDGLRAPEPRRAAGHNAHVCTGTWKSSWQWQAYPQEGSACHLWHLCHRFSITG